MVEYTELLIMFEKEKQQFLFNFNNYEKANDFSILLSYMYEQLGRKTKRIETPVRAIIVKII